MRRKKLARKTFFESKFKIMSFKSFKNEFIIGLRHWRISNPIQNDLEMEKRTYKGTSISSD